MNNEARLLQVEGFFGQAAAEVVDDDGRGLDSSGRQAQWLNPGKRGRTLVLTCNPLSPPRTYTLYTCVCVYHYSLLYISYKRIINVRVCVFLCAYVYIHTLKGSIIRAQARTHTHTYTHTHA